MHFRCGCISVSVQAFDICRCSEGEEPISSPATGDWPVKPAIKMSERKPLTWEIGVLVNLAFTCYEGTLKSIPRVSVKSLCLLCCKHVKGDNIPCGS